MGESFMGFQTRQQIIGPLKRTGYTLDIDLQNESTYNPNHLLSAYAGYRLSTEYLNRSGGRSFCMLGPFYTRGILPVEADSFNLGSNTEKYANVYAKNIHGEVDGNSATATKLKTARKIKVSLSRSNDTSYAHGESSFDGTQNIEIVVNAPYLHLTGGTVKGVTTFEQAVFLKKTATIYETSYTASIIPVSKPDGESHAHAATIGSVTKPFGAVYADNIYCRQIGGFTGNDNPTFAGVAHYASMLDHPISITLSGAVTGGIQSHDLRPDSGLPLGTSLLIETSVNHNHDDLYYTEEETRNNFLMTCVGCPPNQIVRSSLILEPATGYTNHYNLELMGKGSLLLHEGWVYTPKIVNPINNGVNTIPGYVSFGFPSGTYNPGNVINAYIDDLATNNIVASSVLAGGATTSYSDTIRVVADKIVFNKPVYCAPNLSSQIATFDCTRNTDGEVIRGSADIYCHQLWYKKQCGASDIRIKNNISVIPRSNSADIISKIVPTVFTYTFSDKCDRGFIAQQVKKATLEMNESYCSVDDDDENKSMGVSYTSFIPDLVNVCQYLLAKVDKLEVRAGIKKNLEFPDLQQENTFDEAYYREHAKEIAEM